MTIQTKETTVPNLFRELIRWIFGVRVLIVFGEKFKRDDPKNHVRLTLTATPRIGETVVLYKPGGVYVTGHKVTEVAHTPQNGCTDFCIFVEKEGTP